MASDRLVVRWGIAGAGDIANRVMAPAMRAAPHAELVAVQRREQERAEEFADKHGAKRAYDSVEKLAADPEVDAVYVASPVDRHRPDTLACAARGKHILCEKPLALSSDEGRRMAAACAEAGVAFMTCFYQRFNARHREIKRLLAEGAIGQVTAVRMNFSGRVPDEPYRWRMNPAQSGGGCFIDNGSHCVDLLRYFFGEVVAATALVDTLAARYPVEDTASAILRLSNGGHAVVTSYWSSGDPDERRNSMLEIIGTEGIIISTPLHEKFSRGDLRVITRAGEQTHSFDESTHVVVLEEFARALAEQRPMPITIQDGIRAMQVVEAVYESAKTGCLVRL